MKNFSFNENDEHKRLEEILVQRKKKIAKQQIIFSAILFLLLLSFGVYIIRKTLYTTMYGYVSMSDNHIRFTNDIFVMKGYVNIGDFVAPGDTLFSYVNMQVLEEQDNLNNEPRIITVYRDMEIQAKLAQQEITIYNAKIKELEKQIAQEDDNIRFGINDNFYKLSLERELIENKEKLKVQTNKAAILLQKVREIKTMVNMLSYNSGEHLNLYELVQLKDENNPLIKYNIATDSSYVIAIDVAERSIVLKGESVCTLQYLDLFATNVYVAAYIAPENKGKIEEGVIADIIFNDDFSLKAALMLSGTMIEEVPSTMRSRFSDQSTALIGVFRFLPEQKIPFWALTNKFPVKIQINNFFHEKISTTQDPLWFNTTSGKWIHEETNKEQKDEQLQNNNQQKQ